MNDVAIRVEGLSKLYRIGKKQERYKTLRDTITDVASAPFRLIRSAWGRQRSLGSEPETTVWALRDVSFKVRQGEVVGIIGRNGAGKSTLLKILSRITEPTAGRAETHGRVGSLLEVGTGFHSELTGRENVYLNGAILGMRRAEIDRKFDAIVDFAEVEKFIDTPIKHYSSGMHLRLAFAVAAHLQPEILLVDEVLAVGDAAFQNKCLGKMGEVAHEGRTVLFVSHNMAAVRSLCGKGIVLAGGRMIQEGDVSKSIEAYYTALGALQIAGGGGDVPGEDHSRFGPVALFGVQGNSVLQSEDVQVSTTLSVREGESGFSLYCIMEDMRGRQILAVREESAALGLRDLTAGNYAVRLKLPALWLNPGLYSLYFKVLFWGEFGSDRHVSDKFPLDVMGSSSRLECVLHPQVAWSIERRVADVAERAAWR